jgi:HD-like signal output (HDOD) protein
MVMLAAEKRQLLRERIEELDSLPTVSNILRPLLHYLEDPGDQIEVPKVIELVSCDNTITAQCLRIANSPLYGRAREVETVRGAIMALGMRRLREILLSCVLVRLTPSNQKGLNTTRYWQHCLSVALVSRQLAKKINYHAVEKAYLTGLLHDLGVLVCAHLMPEDFEIALNFARQERMPLEQAENIVLGFSHSYAGDVLASHWRLPEEVRQVILYHADVEQSKLHTSLVAIVSMSNTLCSLRGMDYIEQEGKSKEISQDAAWLTLTKEYPYLQESDLNSFCAELDSFLETARDMVSSIFH